jgi:4-hydroxy-2-oxoheptanedioate aldolase
MTAPGPDRAPTPDRAPDRARQSIAARTSERLRALWADDRPAFGVWSTLIDPTVAEVCAASALDYVCIDLQHGEATFTELPRLVTAMRAAGAAPVVRVPWNDPVPIMRAIDTGAAVVVVPMVSSAEEATAAASACRFPPTGTRSWGPMYGYVRPDGAPTPAAQDAAVVCLVMVETLGAVESLDEILAVPGVDGIYVGPNDLALACGFGRGTYRDTPDVEALIVRIVDTARAAGKVAGLHCSDVEMARHWAARGATMLTACQDSGLLHDALAATWAGLHDDEAAAR